jgi:nucleoid-associated protein YgaU
MSVEFRQLSEQLMVLNRNQELLEARLARLEAQSVAASQPSDEVAALRRDMQALRTERDSLRNEITSDLATRIESIAARQQAEINAARAAAAPSGGAAATPARTGSGYEHTVARGQTLSEIARGYGKSIDSIMKANKISNPSHIRVGQVLFIPD